METQKTIVTSDNFFDGNFLNSRAYYMYCYNNTPSIIWTNQLNIDKALKYIQTEFAEAITGLFQELNHVRNKKKPAQIKTIILLKDNCMVELVGEFCQVFYAPGDYAMADTLIRELSRFRRVEKKRRFEIYLISRGNYGLELKSMEINKTKLDLQLYYEEEFLEIDRTIQGRLLKKNDKGIVLLHGLPGTGKTTYLRYLIGKLKKRVLFLSPTMAVNIMNPEFMDLLTDNPNCVVIIEDAENIIMDRKMGNDSAVSNLLNISDGLLADFLNVQVICTFNHPLSLIDTALLRKGRLIAKYEFGKLGIAKAQKLSDHFGFNTTIIKPMTIAEIANQHEKEQQAERTNIIGFRRELIET